MKIVAVTRIRNDEDIVEAFVQHHAGMLDHHIFLDNGSDANTLKILSEMKDDGYRLSVYRTDATIFAEAVQNTFLLHRATELDADWVIFLDCDEFIDERFLGTSLRMHLAGLPLNVLCVPMTVRNYLPTAGDNEAEPIVPLRLRHRDPRPVDLPKVIARGTLGRLGATVERGNHAVSLNGDSVPMRNDPRLILAHYPSRSGWQLLAKALVGRMKVLAAGDAETKLGTSSHYTGMLEFLRRHPEVLMRDHGYLSGRWSGDWLPRDLTCDPLTYLGGPLRSTPRLDPAQRAAQSLMSYLADLMRDQGRMSEQTPAGYAAGAARSAAVLEPAKQAMTAILTFLEALAREHGRMVDQVPPARVYAQARAATFQPLM